MKITIAGFSSVGKKTLIKSLIKEDKYRNIFGVTDPIEAFGYSFLSLDKMANSNANTILFQWQFDVHHLTGGKIYILWREYEEHHADWVQTYKDKYSWVKNTDPNYIKNKWYDVIDRFQGMNYEVINITGWFK